MPREVRWERMFRDELEAAFAARPLVWFSYGLCEPHGPHNALGLDALKAHALACAAARAHGGIAAPPDYWHVQESGGYACWSAQWVGEGRTWMTAVPGWVHFRNVLYHLRAADAIGFHAAVLITGHYGPNWKDLQMLLDYWQPHFSMRLLGLPDFQAAPESRGDHAGRIETSQLWHLAPDCVDASRLPHPPAARPNFATGPDAHEATPQLGQSIVEHQLKWLGERAGELLRSYQEPAQARKPLSFDRTEEIWAATMREVFPTLQVSQETWPGSTPPPESSQWHGNWKFKLPKA